METHSKKKYILGLIPGFSLLFVAIGVGLFMYIQSYSHASPYYTFKKERIAAIVSSEKLPTPSPSPTVNVPLTSTEETEIEQTADTTAIEQELQLLEQELGSL